MQGEKLKKNTIMTYWDAKWINFTDQFFSVRTKDNSSEEFSKNRSINSNFIVIIG